MSKIYWTTEKNETEISGSERAWMDGLASDVAEGIMHLRSVGKRDRLRSLIHPDNPVAHHPLTGSGMPWEMAYSLMFHDGGWPGEAPLVTYDGHTINTFELVLNTALAVGSDAVKLAARLHGQCEIHAWVDGSDKAWLADIIDSGLKTGTLRHGVWYQSQIGDPDRKWLSMGWERVLALLAEDNTSPVVTSYSVCDVFPDMPESWTGTDDEWDDLSHADRWETSMVDICTNGKSLQLKPDDWQTFRFGHKLSVLDLLATDYDSRIKAAFE